MRDAAAHKPNDRPAEPVRFGAPALPHLYLALTSCAERDGGRPLPGTSAALWQAIDRLRAEGGRGAEIGILESVSTEVHRLGFALSAGDAGAEQAARRAIAALTRDWLGVARLCA